MSTSPRRVRTHSVIEEFHANEGRVGGMFASMPLLLLHHTGAKSGKSRINPLAYQSDGGRYVVFASKGGAPANPDWYHNLKAQPQVRIEIGIDTLDVVAREASARGARAPLPKASRAPSAVRRIRAENRARHPVMILAPPETG